MESVPESVPARCEASNECQRHYPRHDIRQNYPRLEVHDEKSRKALPHLDEKRGWTRDFVRSRRGAAQIRARVTRGEIESPSGAKADFSVSKQVHRKPLCLTSRTETGGGGRLFRRIQVSIFEPCSRLLWSRFKKKTFLVTFDS